MSPRMIMASSNDSTGKTPNPRYGLCWRCEWRARHNETGVQPRCECGDVHNAVGACYMYQPVAPIGLVADDPEDERPLFGPPMIAGRVRFKKVAEGTHDLYVDDEGNMTLYWCPKPEPPDETPPAA